MARETVNTKLRTLIKAYLVFNRGKKATAKEISEWINGNNFCLNNAKVNANVIGRMLYANRSNRHHILGDVEMEKFHNLYYYWVEA